MSGRSEDRYQTNFFIHTPEYILARARYNYEHSQYLADTYYDAAKAVLPEIRQIGFIGSDLPEAELLWHVLPEFIMRAYQKLSDHLIDELNLHHGKPMRPDGTKHWVWARVEPLPRTGDVEFDAYLENGSCFNIKGMQSDGLEFMQYDFQPLGQRREFGRAEMNNVRIAALAARGISDAAQAREAIAALSRDGYFERERW